MSKEVKYYSTDKLYTVSNKRKFNLKLSSKLSFGFILISSAIFLCIAILLFQNSVQLNGKIINVGYSENGNADYKVYLKENDYYDKKVLDSGMQYVANVISSINSKFNYELHADENMVFNYRYKITGQLVISDPIDTTKILNTKNYILLDEQQISINSNNMVINEDVDIDYDYYNSYVNSYKTEYGLAVNSKLIVTMNINLEGIYVEKNETLNKEQNLQISIPLSEQTFSINKLGDINESGNLSTPITAQITNKLLFVLAIVITLISISGIGLVIYLLLKDRKKNIYKITVNKILRDYGRIIVNGNIEVNEKNIQNKIYPETFNEMVDASQTLNSPILYYEVIPNEKCFFVIIKGDTIYKYRLTKAYLEKEESESLYEEDMKKKKRTRKKKAVSNEKA